jgi:hypothetical protein
MKMAKLARYEARRLTILRVHTILLRRILASEITHDDIKIDSYIIWNQVA